MPKRKFQVEVFDQSQATTRPVEMEVEASEFLLDMLEHGALNEQALAQETWDSKATGREITIRAKIILKDREGRRKR